MNLNQNNNNNNNNLIDSITSIGQTKSISNQKFNENEASTQVYSTLSLAQNEELPTKFIINNLKIKFFRLFCLIVLKIVYFFAPPKKPTKEDKIVYIKK